MTEYQMVDGQELRVCKVLRALPAYRRYLVALGDWTYDPRGASILIEFEDESRMKASVMAITGFRAGIAITE
jgi:hypothetical protein